MPNAAGRGSGSGGLSLDREFSTAPGILFHVCRAPAWSVDPVATPPVLGPSGAWRNLEGRDSIAYLDSLPGTEDRLLQRMDGAGVVITIRSSTRFTARVFESSPVLRLLSIWGTGTDN